MPAAMTTRERMTRMFARREADRIPVTDSPWAATVERWQREGLPGDIPYADFFGLDRFVGLGVNNAVLWDDLPAIEAEMRRVVPALKAHGGYVFSSDHSVPSSVSLANFRRIVELAKELGRYG